MAKRRIIAPNCYGMVDGRMQLLPVGTIIEADEWSFGRKAETVVDEPKPVEKLEVATPKAPKPRRGRPPREVQDDVSDE